MHFKEDYSIHAIQKEREELQVIIGANIQRVSEVCSMLSDKSQRQKLYERIFSQIFAEIIGCHDLLSQQYLFRTFIAVFQFDEYHKQIPDIIELLKSLERDSHSDELYAEFLYIVCKSAQADAQLFEQLFFIGLDFYKMVNCNLFTMLI
jgi:Vacuolar protein sorting-associated protein 35